MLTKKKKKVLTPKQTKTHLPGVKYFGDLDHTVDHPTREHLVMVPVDKAPNDPHFPKVSKLVPPETYYVFDPDIHEVVHMCSIDATGTPLAWDTDRDGRYFRQARRPLIAPRAIEYCWDASRAFAAGDDWWPGHRDYRGTLGSRREAPGTYTDFNSASTRKAARQGKTPLTPKKPLTPKQTAAPGAKKPLGLKRKPVDDGGILTASGVDHDKLRSAAEDVAAKYDDMFSGAKKKLTRKRK